jgi:hypothetical protein
MALIFSVAISRALFISPIALLLAVSQNHSWMSLLY